MSNDILFFFNDLHLAKKFTLEALDNNWATIDSIPIIDLFKESSKGVNNIEIFNKISSQIDIIKFIKGEVLISYPTFYNLIKEDSVLNENKNDIMTLFHFIKTCVVNILEKDPKYQKHIEILNIKDEIKEYIKNFPSLLLDVDNILEKIETSIKSNFSNNFKNELKKEFIIYLKNKINDEIQYNFLSPEDIIEQNLVKNYIYDYLEIKIPKLFYANSVLNDIEIDLNLFINEVNPFIKKLEEKISILEKVNPTWYGMSNSIFNFRDSLLDISSYISDKKIINLDSYLNVISSDKFKAYFEVFYKLVKEDISKRKDKIAKPLTIQDVTTLPINSIKELLVKKYYPKNEEKFLIELGLRITEKKDRGDDYSKEEDIYKMFLNLGFKNPKISQTIKTEKAGVDIFYEIPIEIAPTDNLLSKNLMKDFDCANIHFSLLKNINKVRTKDNISYYDSHFFTRKNAPLFLDFIVLLENKLKITEPNIYINDFAELISDLRTEILALYKLNNIDIDSLYFKTKDKSIILIKDNKSIELSFSNAFKYSVIKNIFEDKNNENNENIKAIIDEFISPQTESLNISKTLENKEKNDIKGDL